MTGASEMPVIGVVSDTSVVYQWFHTEGEVGVEASRALVRLFGERSIALSVLDLTRYELANIVLRGRTGATAEQTVVILEILAGICPVIAPTASDRRRAARLAEQHRLTMYDATYAAVARARGAQLATLDKALLKAGLGRRPSEIVEEVAGSAGDGSRRLQGQSPQRG